MQPEILKRYAGAVPRYTSYPTAPHFSERTGVAEYRSWLAGLPVDARLSLYLHVPYCDELCWYCGCNTKATQKYEPVGKYVEHLIKEIDLVCEAVGGKRAADHVHFGGGSPSILGAEDIYRVGERLRRLVDVSDDAEFAVEVDPRAIDEERTAAFAAIGVNRLSVGVQDFAAQVQLVTPYVVRPTARKELARPSDGLGDATDKKGNFLGHMNRIYGRGSTIPDGGLKGDYGFIVE